MPDFPALPDTPEWLPNQLDVLRRRYAVTI